MCVYAYACRHALHFTLTQSELCGFFYKFEYLKCPLLHFWPYEMPNLILLISVQIDLITGKIQKTNKYDTTKFAKIFQKKCATTA